MFSTGVRLRVNGVHVRKQTKVGLAFSTEQAKFPNFFSLPSHIISMHTVLVPSEKTRPKFLHRPCGVLAVRSF